MKLPNLDHEIDLWKKGFTVIGIDEVGRGAFAGPLYVGGVVFNPKSNIKYLEGLGINDSKKLQQDKRKLLSKIIHKESLASYISSVSVAKIDRLGIGKATFMAMREAVKNLREICKDRKFFVLVDGFYIKHLKNIGLKNQRGIIHGDEISLSIAAASIIAKVARDEHMTRLSDKHPDYGFANNKGYGTLLHRRVLAKLGPTPFHRADFIKYYR